MATEDCLLRFAALALALADGFFSHRQEISGSHRTSSQSDWRGLFIGL
jgi:hypothetical protein